MKEDKKRKASQIIERIANANGMSPEDLRSQIEAALENVVGDTVRPHGSMLKDLFPEGRPTTDEFVVALEFELYDAMMPKYEGWEWDGVGYRKVETGRKANFQEKSGKPDISKIIKS